MEKNKIFVLIIMIWFSALLIWAVNNVTTSLNNQRSINVQGIPGQPTPQQISSIQMDKDTVWIIDANSDYIRVITHDEDGYHVTGSKMSFKEK
jgi:hypothetical protein